MAQGDSEAELLEFQKYQQIGQGFKIVSLKMKSNLWCFKNGIDAATGELLWQNDDWDLAEGEIKECHFPRSLLECKELSREVTFSS